MEPDSACGVAGVMNTVLTLGLLDIAVCAVMMANPQWCPFGNRKTLEDNKGEPLAQPEGEGSRPLLGEQATRLCHATKQRTRQKGIDVAPLVEKPCRTVTNRKELRQ